MVRYSYIRIFFNCAYTLYNSIKGEIYNFVLKLSTFSVRSSQKRSFRSALLNFPSRSWKQLFPPLCETLRTDRIVRLGCGICAVQSRFIYLTYTIYSICSIFARFV